MKKAKRYKELLQAAKARELMHRESGSHEDQTLSVSHEKVCPIYFTFSMDEGKYTGDILVLSYHNVSYAYHDTCRKANQEMVRTIVLL